MSHRQVALEVTGGTRPASFRPAARSTCGRRAFRSAWRPAPCSTRPTSCCGGAARPTSGRGLALVLAVARRGADGSRAGRAGGVAGHSGSLRPSAPPPKPGPRTERTGAATARDRRPPDTTGPGVTVIVVAGQLAGQARGGQRAVLAGDLSFQRLGRPNLSLCHFVTFHFAAAKPAPPSPSADGTPGEARQGEGAEHRGRRGHPSPGRFAACPLPEGEGSRIARRRPHEACMSISSAMPFSWRLRHLLTLRLPRRPFARSRTGRRGKDGVRPPGDGRLPSSGATAALAPALRIRDVKQPAGIAPERCSAI